MRQQNRPRPSANALLAAPGLASRCQEILDELPIPEPSDLAALLAYLVKRRGRRIYIRPFTARYGLCGAWIRAARADYIYHDAHTTSVHRTHIVAHELAHMLLGHADTRPIPRDPCRPLPNGPNPQLTSTTLGRNTAAPAADHEAEAETLATMMLAPAVRTAPDRINGTGSYPEPAPSSGNREPRNAPPSRPLALPAQLHACQQKLDPLWKTMRAAAPDTGLSLESGSHHTDAGFTLYRRIIEIRDAQIALRPYLDISALAAASTRARSAGLPGSDLDATTEAAAIAIAIGAREAGQPPSEGTAGHLPAVQRGTSLADEIAWLAEVARAFSSPLVLELRSGHGLCRRAAAD